MNKLLVTSLVIAGFAAPAMAQQSYGGPGQPSAAGQSQQAPSATSPSMTSPRTSGMDSSAPSSHSSSSPAEPSSATQRDTQAASSEAIPADSLNQDNVREVQQALQDKGELKNVQVDGMWGPKTEEAIREFQQAQGLPADGQLNEKTISALGLSSSQFQSGQ